MKKFRLLLMMSSLLALVCSFTACNTDIADDYPSVSISLTAGEVTSSSVSFTIKATGADDIYYWVLTAEKNAETTELNLDDASYLDAQTDLDFEQVVTKSSLKASTEYYVYAYAVNFAHKAYSNSVSMTTEAATVAAPLATVTVKVDEDELTDTSFLMWVGTTNAAKAAWLVVPKYTEGVTAAQVLTEGVALAATTTEICAKLKFGRATEGDEVLYKEATIAGDVAVMANNDDEDTQLNIELLFNAVTANRAAICEYFNR